MLKKVALFLSFLVFVTGAFVAGERTLSPVFQSCIEQHDNSDEGYPPEQKPSAFGITSTTVGSYVRCSAAFVEAHNGAIGALATIVIAAFTEPFGLPLAEKPS
ncbi:MAG TPA: hypothetical protein VF913_03965 [Xanthobacteraceae bacterium]